ncbi:MAG: hypothetical protein MRQ13_01855 [Candidatus Midichloria sp.]|nr:hypothetical protein [Candidatus Midichloria sp.]
MKKGIILISKDINNVTIADDRTYILGDQYPFIGLSYHASADFADALRRKKTQLETHIDPNKMLLILVVLFLSVRN